MELFADANLKKKPEIVSRHGKSCSALKGLIDTNLIFSFLPVHINVLLTVKLIKFHGIPSRQCCTACFAAYRKISLLYPLGSEISAKVHNIRANYYFTHNLKFPLTT